MSCRRLAATKSQWNTMDTTYALQTKNFISLSLQPPIQSGRYSPEQLPRTVPACMRFCLGSQHTNSNTCLYSQTAQLCQPLQLPPGRLCVEFDRTKASLAMKISNLTNSRREIDCSIRRDRRLLPLEVFLCLFGSSLLHVSLYGSLMQLSSLCCAGVIWFTTLQAACMPCCMCSGKCA